VPLEHPGEYIAGQSPAPRRCGVQVALFGHAGDGHVHVNALPDTTVSGWREALAGLFAAVTELLVGLGGTPSGNMATAVCAPGLLERFYGCDVMGAVPGREAGVRPPGDLIRCYNPSPGWTPLADLKVGPDAAPIPGDIAARLRELERTAGWATPKPELARSSSPEPRAPSP